MPAERPEISEERTYLTDWAAIEKDRAEENLSLRTLASKHGVPFTTIADHFKRRATYSPRTDSVQSVQDTLEPSIDIVALAKRLVDQLSRIAKDELDLKEHTLLSQSLSQYYKIMYAPPPAQPETNQPGQHFDLSILNEEELEQVQRIFAQAELRSNIIPIRSNAS